MQNWFCQELEQVEGLAELVELESGWDSAVSGAAQKIQDTFRYCLKSLYINELITADKNISMVKGEGLKPDALLYAPETESIVIVELKNISNPAREAGTELSAYAAEVKSYIPFISDGDLINVVISNEWPTLLRHYLYNEIYWHGKNILCLKPKVIESKIRLEVLSPTELIGGDIPVTISEKHLGGYQVCLYDDGLYHDEDRDRFDKYVSQMNTALQAMAIKGNEQQNHGFAFLWKDFRNMSLAPYSITVVNFAPFQSLERFLQTSSPEEFDPPPTLERFLELSSEFCPVGHGQALDNLVSNGERYLRHFSSPRREGFTYWGSLRNIMLGASELISFQSWGIFSEKIAHAVATANESGDLSATLNCPNIALQTLDSFIDSNYQFIDLTYYAYDPEEESCESGL